MHRFAAGALSSVVELIPEPYVDVLDPAGIFGRAAPLHVDLGCGDGSFLRALAERFPDTNFLGIDRMTRRVAKASRRARAHGNVRVLQLETLYAVSWLLPERSVEAFYLLFPDPWPKRRHHGRRVFTPQFLDAIHRALQPGGVLNVATDQLDYFRRITSISNADARFAIAPTWDVDLPKSKFERQFEAAGAPIYRLALRNISPVM